ncbi:hypothetical protein ACFYSF_17210 [Streptomyces canus]|uniref:hypothetical protein n=1 Tax=Streptomyces canus TaxID=58343 RepID=UPI0036AD556E
MLIAGAAVAVAVQRRAAGGAGVVPEADVDARAEAERWAERLGGSLSTPTAGGDKAAGQAPADANERYRAARGQLAAAGSPAQYAMVRQTAVEGLHYVRGARTALGLDPGPPCRTSARPPSRPGTAGSRSATGRTPSPTAPAGRRPTTTRVVSSAADVSRAATEFSEPSLLHGKNIPWRQPP